MHHMQISLSARLIWPIGLQIEQDENFSNKKTKKKKKNTKAVLHLEHEDNRPPRCRRRRQRRLPVHHATRLRHFGGVIRALDVGVILLASGGRLGHSAAHESSQKQERKIHLRNSKSKVCSQTRL